MCTPRGNVVLLAVIFVLFGGFAVSEMVAALLFNSLSLLGDAMSMVVDSATYLLNMVAEHKKAKGASKRTILKLELYVPLVSVLALLGTSVYVLVQAFQTIVDPPVGESGVDTVMLVFAVFNLVIDFVSMFCFARVNKLLGYNVKEEDAVQGDSNHLDRLESPPIQQDVSATDEIAIEDVSNTPGASTSVARLDAGLASRISPNAEQEETSGAKPSDSQVNTNMCSAYTHVLADTLRSFAVLIAAVASLCIESINPQLADAWAAVAVSATIFLVVVPLLQGISRKVKQLRATTDEDEGTTV